MAFIGFFLFFFPEYKILWDLKYDKAQFLKKILIVSILDKKG